MTLSSFQASRLASGAISLSPGGAPQPCGCPRRKTAVDRRRGCLSMVVQGHMSASHFKKSLSIWVSGVGCRDPCSGKHLGPLWILRRQAWVPLFFLLAGARLVQGWREDRWSELGWLAWSWASQVAAGLERTSQPPWTPAFCLGAADDLGCLCARPGEAWWESFSKGPPAPIFFPLFSRSLQHLLKNSMCAGNSSLKEKKKLLN